MKRYFWHFSLTVGPIDIGDLDVAVTPDSANHVVELLPPESGEGPAQVDAVHHETQSPFVHVQDGWKKGEIYLMSVSGAIHTSV